MKDQDPKNLVSLPPPITSRLAGPGCWAALQGALYYPVDISKTPNCGAVRNSPLSCGSETEIQNNVVD